MQDIRKPNHSNAVAQQPPIYAESRMNTTNARGGGRTRTPLRELDFESSASANSATRANCCV